MCIFVSLLSVVVCSTSPDSRRRRVCWSSRGACATPSHCTSGSTPPSTASSTCPWSCRCAFRTSTTSTSPTTTCRLFQVSSACDCLAGFVDGTRAHGAPPNKFPSEQFSDHEPALVQMLTSGLLLAESIGLFFHLETLLLNNNNLASLPTSLASLTKLEKLDLSHNSLRELPDNLGRLPGLRRLNVCANKLRKLPVSLGSCDTLTLILATGNRLVAPPQSVCNEGSRATIAWMRKNVPTPAEEAQPKSGGGNAFPRVRGSQLNSAGTSRRSLFFGRQMQGLKRQLAKDMHRSPARKWPYL